MGVVQLFFQYFLWSHYCISLAVLTWSQTLPCSWLAKWKETEDTEGREMSLCSFVWHRSIGHAFCCITVMRKEDANWVCSWPCHGLWGPISWRSGNSWVHLSLEEPAKVPFTAPSLWAIFPQNEDGNIPDPLSGSTCYQKEACRLHCCVYSLPHCAASISVCIPSWRELWFSCKTMDRACTKAYSLKVHAWTSGKLLGKEKALG